MISVIIPVFNGERFLGACLDSVFSQTFHDFEVIIVNDGSTDGTEAIAEKYRSLYPKQVFLIEKENGGQASARNCGMRRAAGSFIAFLDADDIWVPEKLTLQMEALAKTKADVCYSDAEFFDDGLVHSTRLFSQKTSFPDGIIVKELLRTNFLVNSSLLIRREMITKTGWQDERRLFRNIEDYDYSLRIALHGATFTHVSDALVRYRVHTDQNSGNQVQSLLGLFFMYGKLLCDARIIKNRVWRHVFEMWLKTGKNLFAQWILTRYHGSFLYVWMCLLREYVNYRRWKKYIDPTNPSPPAYRKRSYIMERAKILRARTLVETGTYLGDTPFFLRNCFKAIYTIELNDDLYHGAKKRLAQFKNIHVMHGNSAEVLPLVFDRIEYPAVFWLDAHYSGNGTARSEQGDTPIESEVKTIIAHKQGPIAIVIDDAYLFGMEPGYPTVEHLESFVGKIAPYMSVSVHDEIIFIEEKHS